MERLFIFLALTFFASVNVFSQPKPPKIIGAYHFGCLLACQVIRINSDYTFDLYVDGDLFNDMRNKGKWKFIPDNRIQLDTPEQSIIVETIETIIERNEGLTILIQDPNSANIPDAKIKYFNKNQEMTVLTNEDGTVKIPKTERINISWAGYDQDYSIQNTKTTNLLVKITPVPDPTFNQIFEIRNNKLCDLDENNQIGFCHSKLKKKKELKIFPSL